MLDLIPRDPLFYLVALPAVFIIGVGKGAFGGGLAMVGIPLLALVVDPVNAAIMTAVVAITTDVFALRAFPLGTWSKPDIVWLAPGMLVGLAVGALFFVMLDARIVVLGIALVMLAFTAHYFLRGRRRVTEPTPVQPGRALIWGALGGFSTFLAHAAGPPLSIYLIPRAVGKTIYAGTLVALMTMANLFKIGPYLWVGFQRPEALAAALPLLPMVPFGVWAGKVLHDRLDEQQIYFWSYLLVGAISLKLLFDSLRALFATG